MQVFHTREHDPIRCLSDGHPQRARLRRNGQGELRVHPVQRPRNYTQQNRNVTTFDYTQAITSQFQNTQAVSVWGGEDNTTPDYGKVYISVKPTGGFTLTAAQKSQITTALSPYDVMAIQTVMVDPTFNYIVPQV